jgi:integrase
MGLELTDKLVKELPAPPHGNKVHYDANTTGLGVRITAAGLRTYVFRYRVKGFGTERTASIGDAGRWGSDGQWKRGAWTLALARKRADELRRQVDAGGDPMGELHTLRAAPTINDLADRFEAEYLPKRRPKTQKDYKAWLRLHIRPELGNRKVASVVREDVERLHAKVAKTAPISANRAVAVLSRMFTLGIGWNMRANNPCHGVEKEPEEKRERFLSEAEIARLSEVLAAHPDKAGANAVRLLLLTGARHGEVLSAQWDHFDLQRGAWTKPSSHVKQKKEHKLPLSPPALVLLAAMKAKADAENARREHDGLKPIPWLFPGRFGDAGHRAELGRFWDGIRSKAGLQGVRLHDLRHTHASILASQGQSLLAIGRLLGHSQAATTHRYAHLFDDPLKAAVERAGAFIENAGKEPAAEVVPLPAGGRRG